MTGDWLLLKTKPSRERYAQENLHQYFGCQTFLPLFDDDGKERVLFPSYIFVLSQQWWHLKGAWGVSSVVMIGPEPARLSNEIIGELRGRQERDGLIRLPKPEGFKVNQALLLKDGPFRDYVGLYQGMDGKERVRVLFNILGRKVVVSAPRESVDAA